MQSRYLDPVPDTVAMLPYKDWHGKMYPVQSSRGPAGSACPVGWKIVEENNNLYYVKLKEKSK